MWQQYTFIIMLWYPPYVFILDNIGLTALSCHLFFNFQKSQIQEEILLLWLLHLIDMLYASCVKYRDMDSVLRANATTL